MMESISTEFLTLFKFEELFICHVVCQHLVVLLIIFIVKVIFIFSISEEFRVALRSIADSFLMFWSCILLSL
jgi:hypothetical protein